MIVIYSGHRYSKSELV